MFGGNFGNTPTFGGGGFPSSTANTSVFGQPQQQQPTVSSSLFGGFSQQPKATFGSTFGSPQQTNTMFGQQSRLPAPTTGSLFSQTATVSPFSSTGQTQQVPAGTSIQFTPINGTDTMMKNGQASPISTRHQCITCMKEYENKSLEELRLEDYQLNRKGPQQGLFGSTQAQQQQQPSAGLFSSLGSTNTVSAPFGQTNTFGAAPTSTANSGWLFNSFNQPKPATGSFFSSPAPAPQTSSAFGTNTAFSFGNQQQPAQTSVFGATNNNPVSSLGSTTSAFSFGSQQQPQTQSTGLFGQKPLTTAPATGFGSGFGASAFTNTSTANKPPTLGFSGFGTNSTAPTFGTTTTNFGSAGSTGNMFGGFQSQTQNKPFSFATPFSSQPQPTQPTFGAPSSTGFSFNTAATSAPTMGFGTSTNTFGGGLGNTMNTFSTPNFGSTQPGLSGGFGFGLNTTSTPGFSSFTPSTLFTQAIQPQQNVPQSGAYTFATTPYKDSPLFYNLIANRDFENMVKPTSPAAQRAIKEASRRRTSTSFNFSSTALMSKNVTFPTTHSLSKQMSIFDGFEDEDDHGFNIDVLSPKTMVKKLNLKSGNHSLIPNNRHSISFSGITHHHNQQQFTENGFNDSQSSEIQSPPPRGMENRGSRSENSSPSKSIVEDVVPTTPTSHYVERARISDHQQQHQQQQQPPSLRSGPPPESTLLNDTFEEHICRVTNTRAGYFIQPSIEQLDKLVDENGNCYVNGLVIGRQVHGEIRFIDVVNIAGINIDEIVHFRHKEVVVYPDDANKPPLGTGLNCPAVVCLQRVWPIDKVTRDPIKYAPQLANIGYEDNLRRSCQRLGAEFISYTPESGEWTFKVPHFSKYSCDVEEAEADAVKPVPMPMSMSVPMSVVPKGLGGILTERKDFLDQQQQPKPRKHGPLAPPLIPPVFLPQTQPTANLATLSEKIEHEKDANISFFGKLLTSPEPTKNGTSSFGKMFIPSERSKDVSSLGKNFIASERNKDVSSLGKNFTSSERNKDASTFGKNYITSVVRRQEITEKTSQKEDLFSKISLKSTNGSRYKGMPRVTFGPLGTFITISVPSVIPRNPKFVVNKMRSYSNQASDPLYLDVVEDQLKKQMSGTIPLVDDQIRVLWNALQQKPMPVNSGLLQQEIMMWELFEILWPVNEEDEEDMDYLQTRDDVSIWLSKYCNQLFPHKMKQEDDEIILGLMKMGRREQACELAVKNRNPYLALLLSQAALEKVSSSNCEEQLKIWEEEGALDFLSPDMKTMYRLCAGNTILDQIDVSKMTTSEWLQHFSLYLWYCCPPNVPVHEAVSSFQHLLKNELIERTGWMEEEISRVAFPSSCDSSIPNLCIQLLKLYSFDGYPLRKVLNPDAYSVDCLDYKIAWLLTTHLRSRNFNIGQEHFTSLATSFAYQLEQIGLSHFAVMSQTMKQED